MAASCAYKLKKMSAMGFKRLCSASNRGNGVQLHDSQFIENEAINFMHTNSNLNLKYSI